ncbi:MAG: hypothetical protein EHM39_06610 [Chloroflexi bacterium]|nr:MAG: hypothetical protein EHM39_06610 [Chloroflexota bacterium]
MARRLSLLLSVWLSVLLVGIAAAQSPDEIVAVITSPTDGQQLFGLINVTGSAEHPTAFDSYTLEYSDQSDPNASWMLVQPAVQQQTLNAVLGTWNTNMVPDGVYRLRLRVFLTDGQSQEFTVSSLRVVNSAPTPVPTTAAGVSDPAISAPVPGPSPTSPIEQPPSSNPLAGETTALDTTGGETAPLAPVSSEPRAEKSTRINTQRVRGAFCAGVYLTLGIFGIMIVYYLLRGRLRPYTRRLAWDVQDDYEHE